MNRKNQRQIWVSKKFLEKLEKIKAKRTLLNRPIKGIADLTEEITQAKSMIMLEEELLGKQSKEEANFMKFDEEFR